MIIMDKKLNYNSNNILNYHIPDKNLKKNIISWLGYLNLEKGFSKKTILSYEIDFRKFLNLKKSDPKISANCQLSPTHFFQIFRVFRHK